MTEPIFDHEKLNEYRLSIAFVAAPYGIAKALAEVNSGFGRRNRFH